MTVQERDARGRFLPAIQGELVQRGRQVELRDPSAATTNIQYMGKDAPMVPRWDAEQAIRYGYIANVVAYRCVQIRARTIASLPIRCGPDPVLRQTISQNSPLARLLGPPPGGPAPHLSARKLIAWSVAQKIVTGRYAWELELDGNGTPQYFWPLVAANLKAVPTDGGSDWFRAFTYGRPDKPTKLTPDRVFYDWTPAQDDFRQPESALQAARYDLSIAVMGDRYSYAFLKNGAVPAAVVLTQQPPTQEAQDRFEQRWASDYQGPDQAGSTRFQYVDPPADGDVSKLLDVKVLGLPQKDARFIEQHRASLEMIAISLGVPWSKLDASGRTFDNATQEDQAWWESTILPDLADFEDAWNLDLAPRVGSDFAWFDTSQVKALQQKPDPISAKVGAPALLQARIMTRDEARADYGLAALGGTEGGFLTDAEVALLNPGPTPPIVREAELELRQPEPEEILEPAGPTVDEVRKAEEDRAAAVELRRARVWATADAQVRTLERRWERAMRRLFARQAKSATDRMRGKRGHKLLEVRAEPDPGAIFDVPYWQQETADTTADLYEGVAAHGFARVSDSFGVDFDLEAAYAQEFIHTRANQLAGQVTETTYQQIQDALAAGVAAGDSLDDIASAVEDVFATAGASRAVTIARTEVISAFNGSASLAAAQLPDDVVGGQEWIATRDGRVRESHGEADGQIVGIGEGFEVGGGLLAYPGDPQGDAAEVVNCRCTVAFLTPDEMPDASERRRTVDIRTARAVLRLVQPGEFDEDQFRRALQEAS